MLSPKDKYSPGWFIWQQFRRNRIAYASLWILALMVLVALLADVLANSQPLYARYKGKTYYPAFGVMFHSAAADSFENPTTHKMQWQSYLQTDWRLLKLDKVIWPPIAYSPQFNDHFNENYTSPGAKQTYEDANGNTVPLPAHLRHYFGTNRIGQDLASGLVHGTRLALKVGFLSMLLAGCIGLLLGSVSGYFGDRGLRMPLLQFILSCIGIALGIFYGFIVRSFILKDAAAISISGLLWQLLLSLIIFIGCIILSNFIGRFLSSGRQRHIDVPIDNMINRLIELFDSFPRLLLIITLAAVIKEKSIWLVILIIGLTAWTGIARLTRAEFLRNRQLEYVQAARALGLGNWRIILRHVLPNAIAPALVALAFGAAYAILTESSLSFLGIGVPVEQVSWGSLLSAGRDEYTAWWMVIFPGIALFITLASANLIGEGLRDALDPRSHVRK